MKVKTLIKKLQTLYPNMEVVHVDEDYFLNKTYVKNVKMWNRGEEDEDKIGSTYNDEKGNERYWLRHVRSDNKYHLIKKFVVIE